MLHPTFQEYISALQDAQENMASLTTLQLVKNPNGTPCMSSGNLAVVFKMQDTKTNKYYAVKCFTKHQENRSESYKLISDYLEYINSPFLTELKYYHNELFVDSASATNDEQDIVVMDWIEGETLDNHIKDCIDRNDKYELELASYNFSKLAVWLLSQDFAHGDLKHDNIIVKPDGTLVLIDYDGMYVPAMQGQKAREIGTPNYRHPERTINQFNERIDDFSVALIALSLKAIALKPELVAQYCTSDGLLFSAEDFCDIPNSKLFAEIQKLLSNNEIKKLYSLFLISLSENTLGKVSNMLFIQHPPRRDVACNVSNSNVFQPNISNHQSTNPIITPTPEIGTGYETMVYVEGGSFLMGSDDADSDDDEQSIHKVTLTPYYISKYQVTQKLWQSIMGSNPSYNKSNELNPVKNVSWYDCIEFCNALSERDGYDKVYNIDKVNEDPNNINSSDNIRWTVTINEIANGYRLPSEAQWEFAARGGNKSKGYKYAGSNDIDEVAWYYKNSNDHTHQVGIKAPNELGIFDMSGNVWEWCFDWFNKYNADAQINPTGSLKGSYRVLRGGSFYSNAHNCRSTDRSSSNASYRCFNIWLRLVRVP